MAFNPELLIAQKYDDNILSADVKTKSSWITMLSPSLTMKLQESRLSAMLSYKPKVGRYLNSSKDNYLDHYLHGDLHLQFTRKGAIKFMGSYQKFHEDRGAGYSQGIGNLLSEPDKFREYFAGTKVIYGSEYSIGRLELGFSANAKRLDNRIEAAHVANMDKFKANLMFSYQFRPNTSLLLEANRSVMDYKSLTTSKTLDNTEHRYYLGVKWKATALTAGTLKLGIVDKKFNQASKDSFLGFSWDLSMRWHPLKQLWLELDTVSKTEETTGVGDYTETISFASACHYQWSQQVKTAVLAEATRNAYRPTNQKDGIWSLGFDARYQMRPWLSFFSSISHQERMSTQTGLDYKRNIYTIGFLVET